MEPEGDWYRLTQRGLQIVPWSAGTFRCSRRQRRPRKAKHVQSFLRQWAVIVLQKVRGSHQLLPESTSTVAIDYAVHVSAMPPRADGSSAGRGW
eukprot:872725-Pyramimonas_sp.AAC.1